MFSLLFKTGTYYVLWNKLKGQFFYLLISLVLIVLTLSIYEDVYKLLKVANKDSLWVLMIVKYSILILIVTINFYHFKNIKVSPLKKENLKDKETITIPLEPIEEMILNKKVLKTKSDFILEKYASKKNV